MGAGVGPLGVGPLGVGPDGAGTATLQVQEGTNRKNPLKKESEKARKRGSEEKK